MQIKHLVVDSAAFLKNVQLQNVAENLYTLGDVVREIRDKATRERLAVLPYELKFLEPNTESILAVTKVAKKTGDFSSLSATDLKVLALTYELECQHVGKCHITLEPAVSVSTVSTKRLVDNPRNVVGFYLPQTQPSATSDEGPSAAGGAGAHDINTTAPELEPVHSELPEEECGSEENDSGCEAEDDVGWITKENLPEALAAMNLHVADDMSETVPVGCMSSDFAVQNVLLHMGLHVISLDGLLVKQLRSYVLRCRGCFKTTSVMTHKFCPTCGHPTLSKVAVTVQADGSMQYHLSRRKVFTSRGLNSLPAPRGGKHADNPILCADQPVPENRLSKKALERLDVLNPDYFAHSSPFLDKDVNSRSAMLGLRRIGKPKSKPGRKIGHKRN